MGIAGAQSSERFFHGTRYRRSFQTSTHAIAVTAWRSLRPFPAATVRPVVRGLWSSLSTTHSPTPGIPLADLARRNLRPDVRHDGHLAVTVPLPFRTWLTTSRIVSGSPGTLTASYHVALAPAGCRRSWCRPRARLRSGRVRPPGRRPAPPAIPRRFLAFALTGPAMEHGVASMRATKECPADAQVRNCARPSASRWITACTSSRRATTKSRRSSSPTPDRCAATPGVGRSVRPTADDFGFRGQFEVHRHRSPVPLSTERGRCQVVTERVVMPVKMRSALDEWVPNVLNDQS